MAEGYPQGYPEARFKCEVNRTFECPVCMAILKNPVQCRQNEHHFCLDCVTKHLNEVAHTCPVCNDELTPETLARPSRMVQSYISGLKITCDYEERGCTEVIELQNLSNHVRHCGFLPIECDKCHTVVDKKNKAEHDSEVCEFRVVVREDCGEEMCVKKYSTKHGCCLRKEVDQLKLVVSEMKDELERCIGEMRCGQENWFQQVRNGIRDVRDEMKNQMRNEIRDTVRNEVRDEMKDQMRNEIRDTVRNEVRDEMKRDSHQTVDSTSDLRGDIVALGGLNEKGETLNSVESFQWKDLSWSPQPAMRKSRYLATSVCYQNRILVAGGVVTRKPSHEGTDMTDKIEQLVYEQTTQQWVNFPVKLPLQCSAHQSVIYDNHLLLVGGGTSKGLSNEIHEVLLQAPYTRKLKSRIPQPVAYHSIQLCNDKVLIFGGRTPTGHPKHSVSTVLLYDVTNNDCVEVVPLPLPMSDMATVKWGEDSVIITGGRDVNTSALNTVFIYNYKEGWCYPLPSMTYKRYGFAAVIVGNAIVVMGGWNEVQGTLNTAEYFTFENYTWKELPAMSERRYGFSAVVKPVVAV